MDKSINIG